MPSQYDGKKEDALFERLYDALGEDGVDDLAAMEAALKTQGIDVAATIAQGLSLFEAFRGRQKLARAREKAARLQKVVDNFLQGPSDAMVMARREIAQLLSGEAEGKLYAAVHRKLESVDAEDLKSLKDDAAIATFLERCLEEEH